MLASLAVLRSIEKTTGLKCQLKWPNDVLINNKKVCGILLESQAAPDSVDYAIIGIGINVNMKLSDYPEISAIATSLADETGKKYPVRFCCVICFWKWKSYICGFKPANLPWRNGVINLITLGKNIHVRFGDDVFEGIAESVADDGSLMLRCADGKLLKFMAGDVTLR